MIRRTLLASLLTPLVVLAALAVGVDRLAAFAASRAVASHVRSAADLPSTPGVHIFGFPFLTQLARGRYSHIEVTAHDLTAGPWRFADVRADLFGVRVPLSRVVNGNLADIPVERGTATVRLAYPDLDAYGATVNPRLSFAPDGTYLRITGTVTVAGSALSASGDAAVSAQGHHVSMVPLPATLRASVGTVPPALVNEVVRALTVSVDVTGLPFGVSLRSAAVTADGVVFAASARGLDIPTSG